jgi:hypothetical protein
MVVFDAIMIPIKRHTIVSSAVTYPSLELQRMLVIDHLTLLSVLEAVLDGRGMPSHGKRMKLVGLLHNLSIFGGCVEAIPNILSTFFAAKYFSKIVIFFIKQYQQCFLDQQ